MPFEKLRALDLRYSHAALARNPTAPSRIILSAIQPRGTRHAEMGSHLPRHLCRLGHSRVFRGLLGHGDDCEGVVRAGAAVVPGLPGAGLRHYRQRVVTIHMREESRDASQRWMVWRLAAAGNSL